MVLIIGKGSIEEKIKKETEMRREARHQEDVRTGLSIAKGAQFGDYRVNRDNVQNLRDYSKHKDPKDREKIMKEFRQVEQEHKPRG